MEEDSSGKERLFPYDVMTYKVRTGCLRCLRRERTQKGRLCQLGYRQPMQGEGKENDGKKGISSHRGAHALKGVKSGSV